MAISIRTIPEASAPLVPTAPASSRSEAAFKAAATRAGRTYAASGSRFSPASGGNVFAWYAASAGQPSSAGIRS